MSIASTPITANSSERPLSNRWRRRGTIVLLVLMAVGTAGWRYRITRPNYRLARGEEAIQASDWEQVDGYIDKLEAAGRADEAHMLRGKLYFARHHPDRALAEFEAIRNTSPLHLS